MFVAGKKRKAASGSPRAPATFGTKRSSAMLAAAPAAAPAPAQTINRWYLLGVENFRERQYRSALDFHNRAIALAAKEGVRDAKLYEARSHTLYKLREFRRAMDDAKESIVIDGTSAVGYMHMASILAATGKPGDALSVADRGLEDANPRSAGYRHLQTVRESVMKQLDPTYVPVDDTESDPMACLSVDLAALILRLLDVRSLMACRGVSMRWMLVVDNTPLLWSSPCYFPQSTANQLAGQLPGYAKIKQMAGHSSERVPGKVLRQVFERSRSSLKTVNIPNGSALSDKNLSALLACKRPVLRHVSIYRAARLTDATITRVLNLVVPAPTTEIRLPYCEQVNGDVIKAIATHMPRLRVLDISGCMQVRMKDMFRAWGSTLTEMGDSTSLEELYLNDHPEMPRFLVYSMRHRHFSKLRTLHLAVRDQSVYSKVAGLGPLLTYFHNIANRQMPFPSLRELNLDGVWDATTSARRFEHAQVNELILHCRLFPSGLQELSALESSAVSDARLLAALQDCFSTLRRLHLTNARSPFSEVLGGLVDMLPAAVQFLPLTSLDLSGCVGLTAQALLALVSRCRDLVYINLSQTAANNAVLNKLRELAEMPESAGIEVLVLDTTDITGAAARDFAAACARRFRRRNDDRRISSAWRLRLLDMDNCVDVGSDAVAVVRDLLSPMGTRILAAVPG